MKDNEEQYVYLIKQLIQLILKQHKAIQKCIVD